MANISKVQLKLEDLQLVRAEQHYKAKENPAMNVHQEESKRKKHPQSLKLVQRYAGYNWRVKLVSALLK